MPDEAAAAQDAIIRRTLDKALEVFRNAPRDAPLRPWIEAAGLDRDDARHADIFRPEHLAILDEVVTDPRTTLDAADANLLLRLFRERLSRVAWTQEERSELGMRESEPESMFQDPAARSMANRLWGRSWKYELDHPPYTSTDAQERVNRIVARAWRTRMELAGDGVAPEELRSFATYSADFDGDPAWLLWARTTADARTDDPQFARVSIHCSLMLSQVASSPEERRTYLRDGLQSYLSDIEQLDDADRAGGNLGQLTDVSAALAQFPWDESLPPEQTDELSALAEVIAIRVLPSDPARASYLISAANFDPQTKAHLRLMEAACETLRNDPTLTDLPESWYELSLAIGEPDRRPTSLVEGRRPTDRVGIEALRSMAARIGSSSPDVRQRMVDHGPQLSEPVSEMIERLAEDTSRWAHPRRGEELLINVAEEGISDPAATGNRWLHRAGAGIKLCANLGDIRGASRMLDRVRDRASVDRLSVFGHLDGLGELLERVDNLRSQVDGDFCEIVEKIHDCLSVDIPDPAISSERGRFGEVSRVPLLSIEAADALDRLASRAIETDDPKAFELLDRLIPISPSRDAMLLGALADLHRGNEDSARERMSMLLERNPHPFDAQVEERESTNRIYEEQDERHGRTRVTAWRRATRADPETGMSLVDRLRRVAYPIEDRIRVAARDREQSRRDEQRQRHEQSRQEWLDHKAFVRRPQPRRGALELNVGRHGEEPAEIDLDGVPLLGYRDQQMSSTDVSPDAILRMLRSEDELLRPEEVAGERPDTEGERRAGRHRREVDPVVDPPPADQPPSAELGDNNGLDF